MANIRNINCEEAWKLMTKNTTSLLVDVRTTTEWQKIGIPKLANLDLSAAVNKLLLLSWRILPNMAINTQFLDILTNRLTAKNMSILFICKSGVRSHEAATYANLAGCRDCYNITDGFEGNNTGLGWKSNNLPWEFLENVS